MSTAKAFTVSLEVVEDGPTTNATARLVIDGEKLAATGKARRNPDDPRPAA